MFKNSNRGISTLLAIGIIAILAVVAGGGILGYQYLIKSKTESTACTEEAKICPDGSAVSRTGPNCEFAECPIVQPDQISSQSSITVISPNGGEAWQSGTTHNITWTSEGLLNTDSIVIRLNNWAVDALDEDSKTIASTRGDSTSYNWTIPINYKLGSEYKIDLIVVRNEPITADGSDNYFSIIAPVVDPTAGWQTYTRTYQNASFEIKYPNDYTISESDGLYTSIIFHKDSRNFEIRITENCSSASSADTSVVKLDGINFTKYYESRAYSAQVSTSAYKYCAVVGGWAYNLIPSIVSTNSFAADSDPILGQMLSTFKFIR